MRPPNVIPYLALLLLNTSIWFPSLVHRCAAETSVSLSAAMCFTNQWIWSTSRLKRKSTLLHLIRSVLKSNYDSGGRLGWRTMGKRGANMNSLGTYWRLKEKQMICVQRLRLVTFEARQRVGLTCLCLMSPPTDPSESLYTMRPVWKSLDKMRCLRKRSTIPFLGFLITFLLFLNLYIEDGYVLVSAICFYVNYICFYAS